MYSHLGEMLSAAANRFGSKPGLICTDRTLTFEEVDRLASRFACNLHRRGVNPGDVVTLWIDNGWRWVVAYFGIMRLGAVVNPVNSLLTPAEVDFITRDCRAKRVIGPAGKVERLTPASGTTILDDAADFDSLLEPSVDDGAIPRHEATSDSRAAICYTSGTTGHPKGAVLKHRAVVMNTLMTSLMHGRGPTDTVVSALPCSHVYGNIVMNSAFACGMTLVLFPKFDASAVLEAIEWRKATLFEGVPTMYVRLLNHSTLTGARLSSLRLSTVGGQTMPSTTMKEVERLFGCPLVELWGMTELAGLGTTHPHNTKPRLGSIGVPLPLNEARVAHVDDPSLTLAQGDIGELMIRGPSVMDGYLGNPEATGATIEPDGWLHTGDLVHQDKDGYYFVVDRKKEVILSGGYNVYPAEIERVIASHPAVAMVAVGRIADDRKGELPKAYVVLRPGAEVSGASIIDHCRQSIAVYKIPKHVQFVADLPKTSTGKVLRRELHTLDVGTDDQISRSS